VVVQRDELEVTPEPLGSDTELMPGLDIRVTGGHTADHQIVQVHGDGECFVHLADIETCFARDQVRGRENDRTAGSGGLALRP
jgi:glyoxylase-like metal-dependent hydrolase (beta-lactamase superfamily II)